MGFTQHLNLNFSELIALMRDDIRPAKSPPSFALRMQILNFIMNLNSQSNNDEKNTHGKITRRQSMFEKMSRKRGLVVNFEHVTSSRIRPILCSTICVHSATRYNIHKVKTIHMKISLVHHSEMAQS